MTSSRGICPAVKRGSKSVVTHTYYGRGYVQITFAENYKKLGVDLGYGEQLLHFPDKVLEPELAYKIMSHGMRHGSFTGRKLSDYKFLTTTHYYNARRIINGINERNKSHVEHFARSAKRIEGILTLASESW